MTDTSPAVDFSKLDTEVAGLVNQAWVTNNHACPYAKTGERVHFATPLPGEELNSLRTSIEMLGITNFGVTTIIYPHFQKLVDAQKKHFDNGLTGVSGPGAGGGIAELVAKANVADDTARAER